MVNKLLLSCIVLIFMTRELFAQVRVHHEGQDLPELPTSMSLSTPISAIPFPKTSPEMISAFIDSGRNHGVVEDVGNILLMPADVVFDAVLNGLHCLGDVEQDTITSKVMAYEVRADVKLFPEMMTYTYERESKFLSGFNGTYLSNPQIEDGKAEVDLHTFMIEQKKVVWDILKKTYFAKYRFQAEERLHDDAFYLNNWQGIDYVALPPFMAGYLYYRGLDKTLRVGDFKIHTLIEPGSRLLSGNVIGAVMVDVRPRNWPLGVVGSMGLYSGSPKFEFIGIGTSIDAVKKAIALAQP
jgi:hypothetical protein